MCSIVTCLLYITVSSTVFYVLSFNVTVSSAVFYLLSFVVTVLSAVFYCHLSSNVTVSSAAIVCCVLM